MKEMNRLLDANINRVSEGIRVVEDVARFVYNQKEFSKELREKRHYLRKLFIQKDNDFLNSRDTKKDVGIEITKDSLLDKKSNIKHVVLGNFKRIQEGLRSIEEISKISCDYSISKEVEALRYSFYNLEKEFMGSLKPEIPLGLYGITAENFSKGRSNYEIVTEMIKSGIKIIQYREKFKSLREKLEEAKILCELCKKNNVLFIVNDHVDIALMVDADGVHVGQEDMPVSEIRKILGANKIIGLSTHSVEDADKAVLQDVDYIGVGPIFPTTTKDRTAVGIEYMEYVEKNINLPYIAIGGIKEANLLQVVEKGARRIALVSEIVGADDIVEKVDSLNNIMQKFL
ncbi:MAG: thiamine phosphate synthase [Fusobacteriaceae bacterium]|jgi:thiamine-phosphate pyrophosphorylase|nr:thiamine phosphate synthase [Fusobacteriaceae bacterium]MBP6467167.1 thiamine phosphate synthase [Fusobacteriaceae bacterium]MBP9597411.1 thiamine phosphate synthase [Fusobacteriaceae bacterium]